MHHSAHKFPRQGLFVLPSKRVLASEWPSSAACPNTTCLPSRLRHLQIATSMITGNFMTDGCAVVMVTFLLPLAMYSMRGTTKMQSRVAAILFFTLALSMFSMVSLSLIYASYHKMDYAAAVHHTSLLEDESMSCPARNLTEGSFAPKRSPTIINIAGPSTGIGWWRQALMSFSQRDGLLFDDGTIERITCQVDVFQLEVASEADLVALPRPSKASFIVRDPRSIVAEMWLKEKSRCSRSASVPTVCNSTKEIGINSVIDVLREEGCSGTTAYLCTATSIAAQAALKHGMRFFKYEEFWTAESTVLIELGRWYGLQDEHLLKFLSAGRLWTEEFHKLLDTSEIAQVRKLGAWSKHLNQANLEHFKKSFGNVAAELGYEEQQSWF